MNGEYVASGWAELHMTMKAKGLCRHTYKSAVKNLSLEGVTQKQRVSVFSGIYMMSSSHRQDGVSSIFRLPFWWDLFCGSQTDNVAIIAPRPNRPNRPNGQFRSISGFSCANDLCKWFYVPEWNRWSGLGKAADRECGLSTKGKALMKKWSFCVGIPHERGKLVRRDLDGCRLIWMWCWGGNGWRRDLCVILCTFASFGVPCTASVVLVDWLVFRTWTPLKFLSNDEL